MAHDFDDRRSRVSGTAAETLQLRSVGGILEDANGNRFNFNLTLEYSGPRVPNPPPKFKVDFIGPGFETNASLELVIEAP